MTTEREKRAAREMKWMVATVVSAGCAVGFVLTMILWWLNVTTLKALGVFALGIMISSCVSAIYDQEDKTWD